ncbi:MAG: HAMP domain-containing sensor histidine kinase [Acidimicrobiia bacterium]
MSLRARLTIAVVLLAALGLAVAGVATFSALRSFLIDRVDEQLADAVGGPGQRPGPPPLRTGGYSEFRNVQGEVVETHDSFMSETAPPDLPQAIPEGQFTVSATGDGPRYRALGREFRNGTLVVALPLDDVDSTLQRLVAVEIVVAIIVLGALTALALWVVRVGLRPLEHMGATAGAIAAGDLSQRVEPATERTEVGRLGISLNTMLGQIEQGFAEREASEAKLRQFVADASHELRTPLTSIRGYAELFRRGADERPEDLAKAMRRIEEEGARMGVMVDDLLLLARLDQGRPLEHDPVDLVRIATDAVDDARASYPQRDITVSHNGSVRVMGDDARLRQVLANLLANACTHTPEGTPVRVAVARDGTDAIVDVSDAGPGLDPETAAHAFERFWRADTSRTRARGGTGLGLSIVAAIAEAHGGRATLESSAAGATFRVRLPAASS